MTVFVRLIEQQPADVEVRGALDRIVASRPFAGSPRLTAFLRYVVERTLAGETTRLKGYTIAVEALQRPPSFDPQIDPIVRVEAGRLRRALALYYDEAGRDDPIAIELPRGGYVPVFRRRDPSPAALEAEAVDGADLRAVIELLIEQRRRQVQDMLADIETARTMLRRSREPTRAR